MVCGRQWSWFLKPFTHQGQATFSNVKDVPDRRVLSATRTLGPSYTEICTFSRVHIPTPIWTVVWSLLFVSNSLDPLLPHCWIFLILLYIQLPYMYAFWACINHITSLEFSSVKWRGKLWSGFQFDSLWWKDSDSTCVQSASTTDRTTELLS